jgi:hypothetical protein
MLTDDFRDGLIAALDHALRLRRRTRVHSDERFLVATRLHCMVSRGHLAIWQRRTEGIKAWADPNHKLADA